MAAAVALDRQSGPAMIKMVEQMEIAGFRFTMEPAFDAPLTMNEHLMFNEACECWRRSIMQAMQPWLEPAGLRLVAADGEIINHPPAAQADLEAPGPSGKMPE